jgi:hypothetical protein
MDNAFGLKETFGARWIRREKLYGAQTKCVNRRVIAIKEQPDLYYRPPRYQFSGVPHFQKASPSPGRRRHSPCPPHAVERAAGSPKFSAAGCREVGCWLVPVIGSLDDDRLRPTSAWPQ